MPDPLESLREEIVALKDAIAALTMAINMAGTRLSPLPSYPPGDRNTEPAPAVPYYTPPVLTPVVPYDPLDWTKWTAPPPTICGPLAVNGAGPG